MLKLLKRRLSRGRTKSPSPEPPNTPGNANERLLGARAPRMSAKQQRQARKIDGAIAEGRPAGWHRGSDPELRGVANQWLFPAPSQRADLLKPMQPGDTYWFRAGGSGAAWEPMQASTAHALLGWGQVTLRHGLVPHAPRTPDEEIARVRADHALRPNYVARRIVAPNNDDVYFRKLRVVKHLRGKGTNVEAPARPGWW